MTTDHLSISVCVPSYERPDMLKQLASTFYKQDYPYKELVISDDSYTDDVERAVAEIPTESIRYYRNHTNLGYFGNLRACVERATGDCVILMGDDDVFLAPDTLRRYTDAFNRHPNVGFICCNRVQFSSDLKVEFIYKTWHNDCKYIAGVEGIRGIWFSSIFIPGIAMRRDELLRNYPEEQILFPQVEAAGRILLDHESMGLAFFGIAGRAHPKQLGFEAAVGRGIKGSERHGTEELLDIMGKISDTIDLGDLRRDFLEPALVRQYRLMILKERTIVPRKQVLSTYRRLCANSAAARMSFSLRAAAIAAQLIPRTVISALRVAVLAGYRVYKRQEIRAHEANLKTMVGNCV